jgi:geranylgeranyl diphosphate synthase type II
MTPRIEEHRFTASMDEERRRVEERLQQLLDELGRGPSVIEEAVRYMVLDAGKRLRPLLCLWTHDAVEGASRNACLDMACAIECVHTYSLIHDDLPCMDDDDMRRGKPSCHKKYGEAVAVLAGDALLTLSFDILVSTAERRNIAGSIVVDATRVVSRAAGMNGLIGGQVLDITSDALEPTADLVEKIHAMKTAALISASMETGAILGGAPAAERERIRLAGVWAGRAFQIVDDVLDLQSDGKTLGKTPGKDLRDGKLTYPSLFGIEASKEQAKMLIDRATREFDGRPAAALLVALMNFIVERRA